MKRENDLLEYEAEVRDWIFMEGTRRKKKRGALLDMLQNW